MSTARRRHAAGSPRRGGSSPQSARQRVYEELFAAVRRGNLQLVKSIVVHRGVLAHTVLDKKRWSLLHEAAYWGQLSVAKWLVGNAGVKVNVKNKVGDTPLHFAARQGQAKFARWLVDDVAADIYAENKAGDTAYKAAAKKQHFEVCEFLMERRAVKNVNRARLAELREERQAKSSSMF